MARVPVPSRRFSSRGWVRALIAASLSASAGACTSGASLASNAQGSLACAPGPQGVGTLGPCCGKVALEVSAATLMVDTCSGSAAYSVCDGYNFSCEYVCALPAGYTAVQSASIACPEGGGDAPGLPSNRAIPFDAGGLELGPCSGHVVALIPAMACPNHCPGSVAYAVCDGGAYGECACNIPPGYALAALSDGSPPDTRTEAAADARADAPPADSGVDAPTVDAGKESGGG